MGQTAGVESEQSETDRHPSMAHRLELGLLGVLKEVCLVRCVNDTLYSIWKTNHFSPKSHRLLTIVCEELESTFKPKPVIEHVQCLI